MNDGDAVVDFGCGKGRLNFYLYHYFHVTVMGIEMDKDFYHDALKNKETYLDMYEGEESELQFSNCLAQSYKIQPKENVFYFFNPFSVQLFIKVMNNILFSVEKNPRSVDVILYYPSQDYIYYLENDTAFERIKEVYLSTEDERDCFLVYRLDIEAFY